VTAPATEEDDLVAEGRCWRQAIGSGPTVVLVHGTMDRSSSFNRVRKRVDGFRVVTYDRRGYGRSVELGPPVGFGQQVDDLLDVVGDEPALVFGHSYGGTIALGAAAEATGSIVGIVTYECPLPWMDWWPAGSAGAAAVASAAEPEEAGEAFMRRMIGDARWERLPARTRRARRAEGATLVAEIAQLRPPHPVPFDLADVAVPVVAAHGTEGAPHHARAAQAVAESVPGALLEVTDGAGHGVHLTHAGEVAALVRSVAERVRGQL